MKKNYSNIFTFNRKTLGKTISFLKKSNVVGLPTETVYGLAGNAYSKSSVKKIFNLKGRPKNNPIIIHYYEFNDAKKDIEINENFLKLYKKFCPGPITFILKKKNYSKIHSLALAKLKTVAVRFPNNTIARSILKKINFPLAMPSANKSTHLSPVCAEDVFDEFKNKVQLIIDGGKSKIGIESTVVDLTNEPAILRPGIINKNSIEKTLKMKLKNNLKIKKIKSPGTSKKHYSPGIPVKINQKKYDKKSAFVYLGKRYKKRKNFFSLSNKSNLKEAASKLYEILRIIKKRGYKKIQISKIPRKGSGIAINDRIKRASQSL